MAAGDGILRARDEADNIENHLDSAQRDLTDLKSALDELEMPEMLISIPGNWDAQVEYSMAHDTSEIRLVPKS